MNTNPNDLSDEARELLLVTFYVRVSTTNAPDGGISLRRSGQERHYRGGRGRSIRNALQELLNHRLIQVVEYGDYALTRHGYETLVELVE